MVINLDTLTREQLEDAAMRAGVDEWSIYEDYSGRGMYGAQCVGIVVSDSAEGYAILAAAALNEQERRGDMEADDIVELIRSTQRDSMGRDVILYWPGVTLEGASETYCANNDCTALAETTYDGQPACERCAREASAS